MLSRSGPPLSRVRPDIRLVQDVRRFITAGRLSVDNRDFARCSTLLHLLVFGSLSCHWYNMTPAAVESFPQ